MNQKQRSKDRCRRFPCCISLTRLCLRGFTALQTLFTGTVAKVASLIAIVIGGYQFAHGEPGGKKALAGVAARTGISCLKCWLPWALAFPESKMAFFAIFTIYDDSKIVGLAICADESNPDRGRDSCHTGPPVATSETRSTFAALSECLPSSINSASARSTTRGVPDPDE